MQKHPMEYKNFLEMEKLHMLPPTDHKGKKKLSVKQKSGKLRK